MHKLPIALAVAVVALIRSPSTGDAKPCRAGFPDCRRPSPPPPPAPPPPAVVTTVYQRVVPATLRTIDRAGLARLLAGSPWARLGSREQIRFGGSSGGQQFARPPDGRDRSGATVAIDLIRDRGALLVNIDGWLYAVTQCQMARPARPRPVMVTTTCLEHREAFGGQGYGGATYGGR